MSKTVSGELITIDDSAYDGMDDIVIYGKTVQNLWVNFTASGGGITVTSNVGGSIKLSGTSSSNNQMHFGASLYTIKANTYYVAFVDKEVSGTAFYIQKYINNSYSAPFITIGTTPSIVNSGPQNTFDFMHVGCTINPGATVSGTYRVMLREATEAEIAAAASTPQTLPVYPDDSGPDASNEELGIMPLNDISTLSDTFDDYWCPPGLSSIDNVEIVTAGKNLLEKSYVKFTASSNSAGWSETDRVQLLFDSFLPKGNYYFKLDSFSSTDGGVQACAGYYIDNYGKENYFINLFSGAILHAVNGITKVYIYVGNVDNKTYVAEGIRLNVNSVNYVDNSIIRQVTPVPLSTNHLCSLPDGTRDELRIDKEGNVTLIKRTKSKVFNGSEDWEVYSNEVLNYPWFQVNSWDFEVINDSNVMRNSFYTLLPYYGHDGDTYIHATGAYINGVYQFRAARVGIETVEDFKSWLAVNNMTVVFPLRNEKTISLGKIDLPKLRKKPLVNNVWANGSAATTNFYLDTEMQLTYRQWPGVRADGFKVSGKHNFWDFSSCVASSDSGKPEKKFVTATVPYMSGFYDLSKIYGAIAYESRDVSYTFELLGDDMDDLQRQKTNLLDWLGLVHDEPIYDDTQPNYHYIGSFYEADWEEDETGESGTLTVTFKCQPFLIADRATEESLSVGTHTVVNPGQQVSVFAKANSGSATVKINGVTQAVTTTEQRLTAQLQPGENEVVVTSNSVTLRYYERHL